MSFSLIHLFFSSHLITEQILRESHPSAYLTASKPMYSHSDVPLNPSYRYTLPSTTSNTHDTKPTLTTMSSHMRRTSPLNALQPPYPLANTPMSHIDMANLKQSVTPTAHLSSSQNISPTAGYGQIPKHWLWNTNLFYPPNGGRNMHNMSAAGFLPYTSNFNGFFAASKTKESMHATTLHPLRAATSTIDLSSQRSCCSDQNSDSDSLDVSDGQMTLSASSMQLSPDKLAGAGGPTGAGKKRNPYSIEELLKKPEKRIRLIEPIAFHPPILIHRRELSKSPELDVDSDRSERHAVRGDLDNNNKNNITIEVCD